MEEGFQQVRKIHDEGSSFLTPALARIKMVLRIVAALSWEARLLDMDMAYLKADVEEEIYVELLEELRISNRWAMYGLRSRRTELEGKRLERSQADPCVFRRVLRGKLR